MRQRGTDAYGTLALCEQGKVQLQVGRHAADTAGEAGLSNPVA
jgi:hypothetical protein